MAASQSPLMCPVCQISVPSTRSYVSHMRLIHCQDSDFNLTCGIDSCLVNLKSFGAFNSHVYRHHRQALNLVRTVPPLEDCHCNETALDQSDMYLDSVIDDDLFWPAPRSPPTLEENHVMESAKFLLCLSQQHHLSRPAISDVINGFQKQSNYVVKCVSSHFEKAMISKGIDPQTAAEICSIGDDAVPKLFSGLESSYLQEKYFKEHFTFVEPQEISFGSPFYSSRFSGSRRELVQKTDKFYYIPLLETLKSLLKHNAILDEVLKPHTGNGILHDFCDGYLYTTHPLFSIDNQALQIIAYYNELEVANPLGSYVSKHKLGCVFFFLANVRPRFRSTYASTYLVAVGKAEDINHYGIDTFLTPFVNDLKVLYLDGVEGNNSLVYRGGLLAFLGDNLAMHSIGGFKEGISFALRICRTCLVTNDESQEVSSERQCSLRTIENHEYHCSLLHGPLQSHFSTMYGINRRSVLEDVPGFSVVTNLPHDIMHDLFEGIAKKELHLFLSHCTVNKYFTIKELNERLQHYDFIGSKPTLIDTTPEAHNYKIRQSASQMISFLKELPMLIGDRIPNDDMNYHCLLLLVKISLIVLSPKISGEILSYLNLLVEEKIFLFKELYPSSSIIPKMHYMVHYASHIEKFGPLLNAWTMRQEAKLSFIKRASQRSNFKNVPKTVAKMHQYWLAYKLDCCNSIVTIEKDFGKAAEIMLASEPIELRLCFESICVVSEETIVKHFKWVRVQNMIYKIDMFVLLNYDEMYPQFGKITDIIALEDVIIFNVSIYHTDYFNDHYMSYVIVNSSQSSFVNINDLVIHDSMLSHTSFDTSSHILFISLPYYCVH